MAEVIVDAELRAKLLGLTVPVNLRDEDGKLLAKVIPIPAGRDLNPFEPQVDDAELDRREAAKERRYTTQEVLEHLKSL